MKLVMHIDVRRAADVERVAQQIVDGIRPLVAEEPRAHTATKRRGGVVRFHVEARPIDVRELTTSATDVVLKRPSLIDRVDYVKAVAFVDDRLAGFSEGDLRGDLREFALEDLREERSYGHAARLQLESAPTVALPEARETDADAADGRAKASDG